MPFLYCNSFTSLHLSMIHMLFKYPVSLQYQQVNSGSRFNFVPGDSCDGLRFPIYGFSLLVGITLQFYLQTLICLANGFGTAILA